MGGMKALAEIQVVPLGVGVSVRKEVMRAHEIVQQSGLVVQLHAYGTNVEGELATILQTIGRIHETLHKEGVVRIVTNVKIGTRTDKDASLSGKLF